MLYWYVLFVITGREHHIANKLKKFNENFTPFIPMRELFYKKSGKVHKEMKIIFPSYVFIETSLCSTEFLLNTYYLIRTSQDIIRILRYDDSDAIAVNEDECKSLMHLCNNNHCIEASVGFIEGDRIYVEKGPLEGRESIKRKINRHKLEALIELEIMGGLRQVTIGLEVLRKI